MDRLEREIIMNPSGLSSRVYGQPSLVNGVHNSAIQLDGRRQYVRVAGPYHKEECFGDLDHCPKGYYVGMWLQFDSHPHSKAVYMSNGAQATDGHGIAMSYSPDGLAFIFKTNDGQKWTAVTHVVTPKLWQHVAASWDKNKGLYIYVNGRQAAHAPTPSRVREVRSAQLNDFVIGRSNDPADTDDRVSFKVDDFSFVSSFRDEAEMRNYGPAYRYHMPMDKIRGDDLVMVGGSARVVGPLRTVPGKIRNAIDFSGRGEYVDLDQAGEKCLGNLEKCQNGFYISFFVKFGRLDNAKGYIYSSPHGLNIYHTRSQLHARAQSGRKQWAASYNALREDTWHFVEVSWSDRDGLDLYVDGEEVSDQAPDLREIPLTRDMRVFLGRPNIPNSQEMLRDVELDHLDIFYGTRDMLAGIDFIRAETPTHYYVDFEDIRGSQIQNEYLSISLVGSPTPEQANGKVGRAIKLSGTGNQAVDFGDRTRECLGNLDLCNRGVMYAMWLKPDTLNDGATFLSTSGENGITLTYRNQRLYATAETSSQVWEVSTPEFVAGHWSYLEVSYHPLSGLSLYVNNELAGEDREPRRRSSTPGRDSDSRFYLGRNSQVTRDVRFADAAFDELDMWYADRDYLAAHEYIQRSEPRHFLIPFEELIGRDRVAHPELEIRLADQPQLVPGKVNSALQLRGRGQYAEIVRRGSECLSNLAACTQGITIAAWMKFHQFENNMVFLSTAENGVLMMYKDGYIQVTVNGRGAVTINSLGMETERWYFVEFTWHPDSGLKVYVNNELKGSSRKDFVATSSDRSSFRIGRPNQGDVNNARYSTGNFDIDELEIWYGKREDLMAFGFIKRGSRGYEEFKFDRVKEGNKVDHNRYNVQLMGGARLVGGKFKGAVFVNGAGQYVDLGRHNDKCLGNVDLCQHGMTFSVYLSPRDLRMDQTYIAAPTYTLFYEDRVLKAEVKGQDRIWRTATDRIRLDRWQRITFAWHPKKGMSLYMDDELVDTDELGARASRVEPASESIYVGRAQGLTRVTATAIVDEIQVWYEDIDQLRATGRYRAQVVPYRVSFTSFRNNQMTVRDRVILARGTFRLVQGKGQNTRAVRLFGTDGYIDLGQNFTCGGDLETCQQGTTLRLGIYAENLRDGQVLLDSFPASVWYEDGRLYARLQTSTQYWQVDTSNFRPGTWQRVELTWHPRNGLEMYIDGQREDSQRFATQHRQPLVPSDWRTYLGRGLEGERTYANVRVDNIELWAAYKDYLPYDNYLRIQPYTPPTPSPLTPRPPTPRSPVTPYPTSRPSGNGNGQFPEDDHNIFPRKLFTMTFDGRSYIQINFQSLTPEFFRRAQHEKFQFYFSTWEPNGLILLHDYRGRKIYLTMKNGYLIFVDDNGRNTPREIQIGNRRFDDGRWYFFQLKRDGREVNITVSGQHQRSYTFNLNTQFIEPATVFFGGTANTAESTGGRITNNYQGSIADVKFISYTKEGLNREGRNEVNLGSFGEDSEYKRRVKLVEVTWPTLPIFGPKPEPPPTTTPRPTPPPVTTVTFTDPYAFVRSPERFLMSPRGTIDFNFRTITKKGLLMYITGPLYGKNFTALEIYDGKLYHIFNFPGMDTTRTLISDTDVADGQQHQVRINYARNGITIRLDGSSRVIPLTGVTLPDNLGFVHLGGYETYLSLPWHTWARTGYLGCLGNVRINGESLDFNQYLELQGLSVRATQGCMDMPKQCTATNRCANGYCHNLWNDYMCDCRDTDYSGKRCQTPAWTGIFNGDRHYKLTFTPERDYHVNDISFRFKTMAKDGLIFQTRAIAANGNFIRTELEGGRLKVTSYFDGQTKIMYTGKDLNDMEWHTAYIQRRGGHMEIWVDKNERNKIVLPGELFKLFIRDLYIAGHSPEERVNIPDTIKPYVGYLRNFYINDFDIFHHMQQDGKGIFYQYPHVPLLVFHDITLPTYDSYITLDGLASLDKLNMHFLFKTNEPNGVIFFNEGQNRDMFAVELFDGRLHVKVDTPGNEPIDTATPKDKRLDDGEWHSVSITHKNIGTQRQLMLNVDGYRTPYAVSGIENISLQGKLFVGGIPSDYFKKDYVDDFLFAKTGYRGCLSSVDFGRGPPNLRQFAKLQSITIYDTCRAILSRCLETVCNHGGICHDHLNNGTTYCDCSKTGWGGTRCDYHPLGYYFRSDGVPDQYAMMVYTYPNVRTADSERDEIVFGVMTDEADATLIKLISSLFKDFIEFKLVNGFVRVEYDTDGAGVIKTIRNDKVLISDGAYHTIRFVRTKNNASLIVDEGKPVLIDHVVEHGNFDRLKKIFIGGVYQSGGIVQGTGLRGIVGGLNINGHLIFRDARDGFNTQIINDAIIAPRPYELRAKIIVRTDPPWITDPTEPPVGPFPDGSLPIIPDSIGGAGIGWTVGGGVGAGGGGGGGVDVVVFPDGSGGSAGAVPGGLPPVSGPVAAAQVASVPSLPITGPRAGALMGTLLGLGVLATSLMWAFYRCKPGCCGGAGAGGGAGPVISAPRASTSNIGVVQAASAANTNAAAAGAGAGADMDSPDTALLAGTRSMAAANGGSASYFGQSTLTAGQSSSAVHQRQDSYDSATLRAMGTFSNRGTALGTPGASRHQFSSTSGFSESNMMVTTPGSMQSYQFENANPDYDIAAGVHSNYNSNTLSAGAANAGGFSSSTMSSNYNYSVKTIKTVGGQQQLLGYNAGSMSNVIVTPGAMGEEVRVDCCLMTNDGHSVVTGSSLGPPQVWNMSNGELLRIMQGETVGSTYLHLVNRDRLLVGAINSDLEVNQYSVPKGVHNYVFQIWDFATGRPLDMATERETLSALAVMNDSDRVLFGRSDKFGGGTNVIIWDLLGNQPLKEMRYDAPVGNNDYISYINMSQDDRYVIAGFTNTFDNFAEFVLLDTMSTSYSVTDPNILRLDANPECTAVLPREEAVTGLRNGDLVVWSIRTGQPSRQLLSNNGKHAHLREVKAVARSEDSRFLVSASADGTLKLWDLESERHISTMSGHNDEVWCCAISADNEIIVSGSRDGTIRLWRLRNGQEICAFNAGVDVFYITMSRDKGTIVALGDKFGARKLIMLQVVRSKVKRQVPA